MANTKKFFKRRKFGKFTKSLKSFKNYFVTKKKENICYCFSRAEKENPSAVEQGCHKSPDMEHILPHFILEKDREKIALLYLFHNLTLLQMVLGCQQALLLLLSTFFWLLLF